VTRDLSRGKFRGNSYSNGSENQGSAKRVLSSNGSENQGSAKRVLSSNGSENEGSAKRVLIPSVHQTH
jgi:hypothetical protein